MCIHELDEEDVEQQFVERHAATQRDAKEGEVLEVGVRPSKKMQQSGLEIDMITPRAIKVRRQTTIMDRATLLDIGICTLDPKRFTWI
jgi:hypothetical protein